MHRGVFRPDGSALAYSTFLGGSSDDLGFGIAVDATGAVYVTGLTASGDFPKTAGAFDESHNGSADAFIAKFAFNQPPQITSLTASPANIFPADRRMVRVTLTVVATDDSGLPPTCAIDSVVSNQAPRGVGPDIVIHLPLAADLRAERPQGSANRKYTITVKCTDGDGAFSTAQKVVEITGIR
jgi:hypothetical protein